MIEERVAQFWCNPEFYPYLIKVLERLPEEVLFGEIFGDQRFEIISIDPGTHGRSFRLPHPTRHFIILSEALLELPEHEILHTIAHEIGHRVAGAGKTGLWEKEAEDLVRAWGFTEESKKAAYLPALFEMEGYRMGQLWASRQSDLAEFLGFYDEWRSGNISPDRINELVEQVKAKKIHLEIAPLEVSAKDMLLQLAFDKTHTLELALAIGVMTFLEECNELSPVETCAPTSVEDDEIYCQCDWCGRDIKYGNASLSIDRMIQQADWDSEYDGVRLTVIDSQPLINLCARCAGKMNHHAIPEALATCRYDLRKKPDPPAHG